jgi:hypothetical protein
METNGAIFIFHDDNPHIPKEIKSIIIAYLKWAVINFLLYMNNEIKGKMVIPLLNCI